MPKKLSNPVASLISVPFQFNYDRGYGPKDGYRSVLNIQPVVPFSINDDWNVISRTITPVIWQNDIAGPRRTLLGSVAGGRSGGHGFSRGDDVSLSEMIELVEGSTGIEPQK